MGTIKTFTHLNVRVGSHAYGFNTPESDVDTRGVKWVGEIGNLIGFASVKDYDSDKKVDTSFHSFRQFLVLAVDDASFTQLDLLFTRSEDVLEIDNWGGALIAKRNDILSKHGILNSSRGFAKHQYHFVERNRPENRATREGTLVVDDYSRQYRKAQHHSIRTLWQALYCFQNGIWPVHTKTYDVNTHDMLMSIKNEAMPYDKWCDLFNDYLARVEQAYLTSTLPERCDKKKWEELLIDYNLWLIGQLWKQ